MPAGVLVSDCQAGSGWDSVEARCINAPKMRRLPQSLKYAGQIELEKIPRSSEVRWSLFRSATF